jgi:hypothetical protein
MYACVAEIRAVNFRLTEDIFGEPIAHAFAWTFGVIWERGVLHAFEEIKRLVRSGNAKWIEYASSLFMLLMAYAMARGQTGLGAYALKVLTSIAPLYAWVTVMALTGVAQGIAPYRLTAKRRAAMMATSFFVWFCFSARISAEAGVHLITVLPIGMFILSWLAVFSLLAMDDHGKPTT